jgi:hypothetical protein
MTIKKITINLCSGFGTVLFLMIVFRLFHWTNVSNYETGNPLSVLMSKCVNIEFLVCYFCAGIILGMFHLNRYVTALGMILPLPISAIIDILFYPTTHNLLPFEVVLEWFPAFLLSLIAIWLGSYLFRFISKNRIESKSGAA